MKNFVRSSSNVVFTGILGGLGDFLGIAPKTLRLFFAFLFVLDSKLILLYVILMFLMPKYGDTYSQVYTNSTLEKLKNFTKHCWHNFHLSFNEACAVLFKD